MHVVGLIRTRQTWRKRHPERGASMVEFALVSLPLMLLIMGAIEFGWSLNQMQDVRYGAREGARLAAVSNIDGTAPVTAQQIVNSVCSRMDSSSSAMHVSLIATPSSGSTVAPGDKAVIKVDKPLQQITGFFSGILGQNTAHSQVTFYIEQVPTWSNTSAVTESGGTISGGLTCP